MDHLRMRKWIISFGGCAALIGSASCATPYQALGSRGGYHNYRITGDTFKVSFRGNSATRLETVELYLLRRAAEITLEHGFTYFVLLSEEGRTRKGSLGYSGIKVPVVSPGAAMQIRCFHERPPDADTVIDANEFLGYNFPETE